MLAIINKILIKIKTLLISSVLENKYFSQKFKEWGKRDDVT